LLSVNKIGCRVNGDWLWRDVSFNVGPGHTVGVSGRTGAGKTLLLRTLVGLQPLQAGEIKFEAKSLQAWHLADLRCRAVYLPQQAVALADTVEADLRSVWTFKRHRTEAFARSAIVDWLGRIDKPESFLNQASAELSGGERQIVALLRAFQLNPKLLLLDEPTAALDPASVQQVEALLRSWVQADAQRAYLLVSHDPEQRKRLTDTTIRLGDQ